MRILPNLLGRIAPRSVARIGKGTRISGRIEKRHKSASITIGEHGLIAGILVAETGGSAINIGNNVFIGRATLLDCLESIIVEDHVLISYQVIIMDSDNHSLRASERIDDLRRWRNHDYDWTNVRRAPVVIRSKAWIGARAIIAKGVVIGEGAVVATGSVVTRDVAPFTIVAGNPARTVRELSPDER